MTGTHHDAPHDSGNRVITYDDVVRAAARRFDETCTVDVQALAGDLAVSRATLYRVIPGRDRVLGDVLWRYAAGHHRRAVAATAGHGAERFVASLRLFGETVLVQRSFRGFLEAEPDTAIRVLITPAGGVHERFCDANAVLLAACAEEDALTLPFDLGTTAYVLSRVYESMWYADTLSGREPDFDVADGTARAILTGGTPS